MNLDIVKDRIIFPLNVAHEVLSEGNSDVLKVKYHMGFQNGLYRSHYSIKGSYDYLEEYNDRAKGSHYCLKIVLKCLMRSYWSHDSLVKGSCKGQGEVLCIVDVY